MLTETGEFLALDLGGTNFRVLLVTLRGQEVKMDSKIFLIPQHIMLGSDVQVGTHRQTHWLQHVMEDRCRDQNTPALRERETDRQTDRDSEKQRDDDDDDGTSYTIKI